MIPSKLFINQWKTAKIWSEKNIFSLTLTHPHPKNNIFSLFISLVLNSTVLFLVKQTQQFFDITLQLNSIFSYNLNSLESISFVQLWYLDESNHSKLSLGLPYDSITTRLKSCAPFVSWHVCGCICKQKLLTQ